MEVTTDELLMMIGIREVEKLQVRKQLEELQRQVREKDNEIAILHQHLRQSKSERPSEES